MNMPVNLSPRILIVDDDPLVRQTLRDLLADQGFTSFGVSNGPAALHACATQPIDLTLLDFALSPAMHGISTLKHIRQDHPDMKVIIITGCPHPVLIGMAYQLNARQCLIKPIDPQVLIQAVHRELGSSSPA